MHRRSISVFGAIAVSLHIAQLKLSAETLEQVSRVG
jgi:hypothetical protein